MFILFYLSIYSKSSVGINTSDEYICGIGWLFWFKVSTSVKTSHICRVTTQQLLHLPLLMPSYLWFIQPAWLWCDNFDYTSYVPQCYPEHTPQQMGSASKGASQALKKSSNHYSPFIHSSLVILLIIILLHAIAHKLVLPSIIFLKYLV